MSNLFMNADVEATGPEGSRGKTLRHLLATLAMVALGCGGQGEDIANSDVEYRETPSYEEFTENFLLPLKPVVIRGALAQWSAVRRWTPDFFKQEFGDLLFTINDSEYGQAEYD